ncbi:MAG TPA: sigma-70 family RNA polymerase sigma factor [Acidimicrobiia bacterium]|nr:sigma-70 family RNA polymerase sigma factor [Acidimicrobiia bacterium]
MRSSSGDAIASHGTTPREPHDIKQRRTAMNVGTLQQRARRDRFEQLAGEVYEPLQRYARRRVDPDVVDDVVSDVMMTLWRRLDDVPPNARLPWAYGVARRAIANQRRAASRHLKLLRRVEAEPPAPTATDIPLDAELQAGLDQLSESDRDLLRLWAWEHLEATELSVVLGLTPNAASIRLHRAKKKLAENLEVARKNEMSSGHSGERRKEERS